MLFSRIHSPVGFVLTTRLVFNDDKGVISVERAKDKFAILANPGLD
jgi:hypothetical protein